MAILVNGNYSAWGPSVSELVEREARKLGISRQTTRPLSFDETSKKIGDLPALLMLSMLGDSKCSKEGIGAAVEIMYGLAGGEPISLKSVDMDPPFTRLYNFELGTAGFLSQDLSNYKFLSCYFRFVPEAKYQTCLMRDGGRGSFSLDLEIKMGLTVSIPESVTAPKVLEDIEVASVVVEFDGPTHLQDESVRNDKSRDSMIQGLGKTVFRIQSPYKTPGPGSAEAYHKKLSDLVKETTGDIKEHFRRMMYRQIEASRKIHGAIETEKAMASLD